MANEPSFGARIIDASGRGGLVFGGKMVAVRIVYLVPAITPPKTGQAG